MLDKHKIDPRTVLVLRHTVATGLRNKIDERILFGLASEHPAVFNAYQQLQDKKVENRMKKAAFVASFIGHESGAALFIGLYKRVGEVEKTPDQLRAQPSVKVLEGLGFPTGTQSRLWFDLQEQHDFFSQWKGKLTIKWPAKELNWHRTASDASFQILAIHSESLMDQRAPHDYRDWSLKWSELKILSRSQKDRLRGWRGIYFIFDASDGRGYVGKASGRDNLLGRWLDYSKTGHGGNKELRGRDAANFRFSILEIIPGDLDEELVQQKEQNWIARLRTNSTTHGLNLPQRAH